MVELMLMRKVNRETGFSVFFFFFTFSKTKCWSDVELCACMLARPLTLLTMKGELEVPPETVDS